MKLLNRLWPVLCVAIAGCGGGGSDYAPVRPSGVITGAAIDGPLRNATVRVYPFPRAADAAPIAITETDLNGQFSLEFTVENQPLLIEVDSGLYTEDVTLTEVTVAEGEGLSAVINYTSGQSHTVNVTPLTLLATGFAEYLVQTGAASAAAVTDANKELGLTTGVGDLVETTPRRLNASVEPGEVTADASTLYGFLLAAFSSYTASLAADSEGNLEHRDVPSIALARTMYDDIRADGVLDGKGPSDGAGAPSLLEFGGVALDANTYRSNLAQHMLVVANSAINQTHLAPEAILPGARAFAEADSPAFPGASPIVDPGGGSTEPPPPLDADPPVIAAQLPEGPYLRGVIQVTATVTDASGLRSITFDVDGKTLGDAADVTQPSMPIDTAQFTEGEHFIGISAVDTVGNIAYQRYAAYFDNVPPEITVTSAALTKSTTPQLRFTLTGTVTAAGATTESISVDGNAAEIVDGTWSVPVTLKVGHNPITLLVRDALGNEKTLETLVDVDGAAPELYGFGYSSAVPLVNPNGRCSLASLETAGNNGAAPVYFDMSRWEQLGAPPYSAANLEYLDIPYIKFSVNDRSVGGVYTPIEQLEVWLEYSGVGTSRKVLAFNNSPDTVGATPYFLVPLTSAFLGSRWVQAPSTQRHTVTFTVKDTAGHTTSDVFQFRGVFSSGPCPLEAG